MCSRLRLHKIKICDENLYATTHLMTSEKENIDVAL